MNPIDIIITGHSHRWCLGIKNESKQLRPGIFGVWAPDSGCPSVETLREIAKDKRLVLLWMGNDHLSRFMYAPTPLFDFRSSAMPRLGIDPAATLVSEASVAAKFAYCVTDLQNALLALKAPGGPVSVTLVTTPPPKKLDSKLWSVINTEFSMPEGAKLTPPYIRLKLWALLMEMNKATAFALQVPMLDLPPRVQDEDGFLKEEFYGTDSTHAGGNYGNLLLDHIYDHMGGRK